METIASSQLDATDDEKLKRSYCPLCQFPFKSQKISTPSKHISKCKRNKALPKKECSDGISCVSVMETHYKLYCHKVLAEHRKNLNGVTKSQSTTSAMGIKSNEPFVKIEPVPLQFPSNFIDLTDSQNSSEEFKCSKSSTNSVSSQMPTATVSGTTGSSLKVPGKRKIQNRRNSESATSKRMRQSSQISSSQKRRVPNQTSKTSKGTFNKTGNNSIIERKPITENPWSITASQVKKARTPLKKIQIGSGFHSPDGDIIDLTQDSTETEDLMPSASSQSSSTLSKGPTVTSAPSSSNKNKMDVKPRVRRTLVLSHDKDSSSVVTGENKNSAIVAPKIQNSNLKKYPVVRITRVDFTNSQTQISSSSLPSSISCDDEGQSSHSATSANKRNVQSQPTFTENSEFGGSSKGHEKQSSTRPSLPVEDENPTSKLNIKSCGRSSGRRKRPPTKRPYANALPLSKPDSKELSHLPPQSFSTKSGTTPANNLLTSERTLPPTSSFQLNVSSAAEQNKNEGPSSTRNPKDSNWRNKARSFSNCGAIEEQQRVAPRDEEEISSNVSEMKEPSFEEELTPSTHGRRDGTRISNESYSLNHDETERIEQLKSHMNSIGSKAGSKTVCQEGINCENDDFKKKSSESKSNLINSESRSTKSPTDCASSKPQGQIFQSTQVPNLEPPSFGMGSTMETQDSEDWSIPPPRGPGFLPVSPIKLDPSSSLSPGISLGSDEEDFFTAASDFAVDDDDILNSSPDKNDNFVLKSRNNVRNEPQNHPETINSKEGSIQSGIHGGISNPKLKESSHSLNHDQITTKNTSKHKHSAALAENSNGGKMAAQDEHLLGESSTPKITSTFNHSNRKYGAISNLRRSPRKTPNCENGGRSAKSKHGETLMVENDKGKTPSLKLSDDNIGDGSDVDSMEYSLLVGLAEAQTLPLSTKTPPSKNSRGIGSMTPASRTVDQTVLSATMRNDTLAEDQTLPLCQKTYDIENSERAQLKENVPSKPSKGNTLPGTSIKSPQKLDEADMLPSTKPWTTKKPFPQEKEDKFLKKTAKSSTKSSGKPVANEIPKSPVLKQRTNRVTITADTDKPISKNSHNEQSASFCGIPGPSTFRDTHAAINGAGKPSPSLKKWLDSGTSSNSKKQGDIGSMLFGMKPKIKEKPLNVEKEVNGTRKRSQWKRNEFYGGGTNPNRKCPFYKKVSGTDIAVDAFSYGVIDGIQFYFLSHFHSDHYMGLNKKTWTEKVYCGKVTGNLVRQKLGLSEELIVRLPMWEEVKVGNAKVTLLEANHCPGAVLFLFKLRYNRVILHTGDFRAHSDMEQYKALQGVKVETLYLDTTYLNPNYQFPLQRDVINTAVSIATDEVTGNSKTLFVVGTYLIGKERIFAAIAKAIESPVFVAPDKFRTVQCLEDLELTEMVTKKPDGARVHVVSMKALNVKDLKARLLKYSQFEKIVGIRPTGWTHDSTQPDLKRIEPVISGHVRIYGLPYSEHSSFEDLRRFVKFLRPTKIIPTVNIGRKDSREKMSLYLDKWKYGLDP